jgi:hypothetical protein
MTFEQTKLAQGKLAALGLYPGAIDGIYGPMTRAAAMLFQRAHPPLLVDGIIGPRTWAVLMGAPIPVPPVTPARFYIGDHLVADRDDIDDVAVMMAVEPAALRAVVEVESSGRGFDLQGRPTVLYEPHIAWRLSDSDTRKKLLDAGLAYAVWGAKPYPRTSDERFRQIDLCASLASEELAARSASWGLGQIMGFNYESCGYVSAVAMVSAFAAAARNQIYAMAAFIMNNLALASALKRHDWQTFKIGYNGPGANDYLAKLEAAYARQRMA